MEAAKEQSGPFRFNQSLGRRDSGSPKTGSWLLPLWRRRFQATTPGGRKARVTPLCVWDSVLVAVFPAQDRRTIQVVKRV